jgi:hypothetical protein
VAVVGAGRCRAALARRIASRLRRRAALVLLACVVSSCSTRDVFLVPEARTVARKDAGSHLPRDAGPKSPPSDASVLRLVDAARGEGGRPSCFPRRTDEPAEPVGIYLMVDQSAAMQPFWDDLSSALRDFINESNGLLHISMGSQYYPATPPNLLDMVPYVLSMCAMSTYATPYVAIAPLPDTQLALIDSVTVHGPATLNNSFNPALVNESPTDSALSGGVSAANVWAANHSTENPHANLVLITTGVPSKDLSPTCHPELANAIAAAQNGFNRAPRVRTFVLGVTASDPDLDAIAFAGGSEHAYYATRAPDIAQALRTIRLGTLPCELALAAAEAADPRLAVELTLPSGAPQRYTQAASLEACDQGAAAGQWFRVRSGEGTKVQLCPRTCEAARTVAGAELRVFRSCPASSVP